MIDMMTIAIVISSLVVGGLARLAVPGPDPMPIWMTILIGFLGSIVGVVVGQLLFGRTFCQCPSQPFFGFRRGFELEGKPTAFAQRQGIVRILG